MGRFGEVVTNTAAYTATLGAGAASAAFQARHLLEVRRTGAGLGGVTSLPFGIDCGNDCRETFPPATTVTLTARLLGETAFSHWDGACATGQEKIQSVHWSWMLPK